ncbi:hypothetical protein [Lutimonas sp.]|uniref:hypothetical protein n=1 Tax=Lutimonas sp. TaxID=1872403 RepID=UPI003D9B857B
MIYFIDIFLYLLSIYFICGLIFGLYFIFFAATKFDILLKDSKKRVRLLLLPGLAATWPVFIYRIFHVRTYQNGSFSHKKIHIIIWILIILVIPPFIYGSINLLEFKDIQITKVAESSAVHEGAVVAENDIISIRLEGDQLSLSLKNSLKSASSLVYSCDTEGNKLKLVGQLNSYKTYRFRTEPDIKGIIIYDGIKNKTVTKVLFP